VAPRVDRVDQLLEDLEATAQFPVAQVKRLEACTPSPLSLGERKGELEGLAKRPLEDNSAEAPRRELGLF
jgi:hypothetical protein